jgi:type I site-specific restriction endonuclease
MPGYEVATEDLIAAQQQLGVQTQTLGEAQAQVPAASNEMIQQITESSTQTQSQIEAVLADLSSVVTTADQTAQSAQWTGPDSEQFRAVNADLMNVIIQTNQRLSDAFTEHLAATHRLDTELEAANAEFAQAAQASADSTQALAEATGAEAESYEQAFAGGFTAG